MRLEAAVGQAVLSESLSTDFKFYCIFIILIIMMPAVIAIPKRRLTLS